MPTNITLLAVFLRAQEVIQLAGIWRRGICHCKL